MTMTNLSNNSNLVYTKWLVQIDRVKRNLSYYTKVAEIWADKVISQGGEVYVGGDYPFWRETIHRAGGLSLLLKLTPDVVLDKKDVVLIGFEYANPKQRKGLISSLLKTGTTILLFAEEGADQEYKKHELYPDQLLLISSAPGLDGLIEDPKSKNKYVSLTGMSNVLNLWLINVEFIAACTRRKRMPNIYVSVTHPLGYPFNGYNNYYNFFQEHEIKPIEGEKLARELIFKVSSLSHKIVESDSSNGIAECADWIHSTINSKTSHIQESLQGHWATNLSLNDYTPEIFKYTGKLKAGDLKIYLAYSFYPTDKYCYPFELMEPLLSSGVRVIFMTTSDTDQDKFKGIQMRLLDKELTTWADIPRADNLLLIDGHWPQFDAGISIPDFPYPICPLSWLSHGLVHWLLAAETVV
jgi:hypothetical protein